MGTTSDTQDSTPADGPDDVTQDASPESPNGTPGDTQGSISDNVPYDTQDASSPSNEDIWQHSVLYPRDHGSEGQANNEAH
jgi:hypothetical protein